MKAIIDFFERNQFLAYALFFIGYFLVLFAGNVSFTDSPELALAIYGNKVTWMAFCAFIFLSFLLPLLKKRQFLKFIIGFYLLMTAINLGYSAGSMFVVQELFPAEKAAFIERNGDLSYWQRINPLTILIRTPFYYTIPTLILLTIRYAREQHKLVKLNEQKNAAELNALKNQLNPHFLFNTLNNIYSLALQKSDKTPEVVSGLADMLDYMIYKTDEKFVPIGNEVKLLEDYISLEKVRYGDRFSIDFETNITKPIKIAPLVLLTFFENAFKHGVSEELEKAIIRGRLESTKTGLTFNLSNTIPTTSKMQKNGECLGLNNVRKQLDLLYGEDYNLTSGVQDNEFIVSLELADR